MVFKKLLILVACVCTCACAMEPIYRKDSRSLFAAPLSFGSDILLTFDDRRLFNLTPVLGHPGSTNIAFYVDGKISQRKHLGLIGPEGTGIKKIVATNLYAVVVVDEFAELQTYILDTSTAQLSAPMYGEFVAYSNIGRRFVTYSPNAGLSGCSLMFYNFDGSRGPDITPEARYNIYIGTTPKKTDPVTNWQPLEPGNSPIFQDHNWRYLHVEHRHMLGTTSKMRDAAVGLLPPE